MTKTTPFYSIHFKRTVLKTKNQPFSVLNASGINFDSQRIFVQPGFPLTAWISLPGGRRMYALPDLE